MQLVNIQSLLLFNHQSKLSNFLVHIFSYSPLEFAKYLSLVILSLVALRLIFLIILKTIHTINQVRDKQIFLEITPPKTTEISAISTTQLFNLISGILQHQTLLDMILLRQSSCSFEIVSQKEDGIRYILRVPENISESIEKNLRSYIPGIRINKIEDYLPLKVNTRQSIRITEYKLAKHFSLPLNEQIDLKQHDPIAFLTGNMTQLKDEDLLALQVILQPINNLDQYSIRRQIRSIQSAIRVNRFVDFEQNIGIKKYINLIYSLLDLVVFIITVPLYVISEFITGHPIDMASRISGLKKPTPAVSEMEVLVKSKINQPIFQTTIRALTMVEKKQLRARSQGLRSAFASFHHTSGQSLIPKWNLHINILEQLHFWHFRNRLSSIPVYLAPSEISALYHFPFTASSEIQDLIRVKSRELPAPLSLKNNAGLQDIVVGINNYAGEILPIGITLEQRQKHMYVIGKTGTGKTTLLTNAIYQDMLNGKGLAVFDPHGDMLQELLQVIPKNRRRDVIVFDPSDRDNPIGLNILSPGVDFSNKEDEQDWITSSVISIFTKITAKEYWGPRMEHILRNATLTALQMPNPSLYTIQRLLTDKSYQKKAASGLSDPILKQFWSKEFALLGNMQLSSVTAPLTQRIGHFITSKMSRHILLQEKSTINMSEIMNEGKILLVNLSKGDLGEDQSFFFGTILTSIIWMAAYQRTKIPEPNRKDFFLYVDEFQNFATTRFSEITSEGRKFHISLTASHQNIAQVEDPNILKIVAGNASTIICLKASPDDEKFILPFMEPEVEKGDIVNLPPFHFYMKVTNENSENAFSGITVPLNVQSSEEIKCEVIEYSREKYGMKRIEIEQYLDNLFLDKTEKPMKSQKKIKDKNSTNILKPEKIEAKETLKSSKRPQIKRLEA